LDSASTTLKVGDGVCEWSLLTCDTWAHGCEAWMGVVDDIHPGSSFARVCVSFYITIPCCLSTCSPGGLSGSHLAVLLLQHSLGVGDGGESKFERGQSLSSPPQHWRCHQTSKVSFCHVSDVGSHVCVEMCVVVSFF
jgi:hypothetical protein